MMNFLRRFMAGRYGGDQLNNVFLLLSLLLILLERFTRWRWITVPVLALLCLCYFRVFSRNIQARYAENQRFLHWWRPLGTRLHNIGLRFRDRKTHRYFKCPHCRQRLRVPRGRGKINITCPHCQHQFIRKS